MTVSDGLVFWALLLLEPADNSWLLTQERIMSCYYRDDQWYQYIQPLAGPSGGYTLNYDGAQLCVAANGCHASDQIVGYYFPPTP